MLFGKNRKNLKITSPCEFIFSVCGFAGIPKRDQDTRFFAELLKRILAEN